MSPVLICQLPRCSAPKVLLQSRQFSSSSSPATPRTTVVLPTHQFSSSSSPATPRTKVVLPSHLFSSSNSPGSPHTIVVLQSRQLSSSSSPATPRTTVKLQSRQFSSSSSPDTRAHGTSRPQACFSRTRPARSPQRVVHAWDKSRSRLHFAHLTRTTISAEGCARVGQIALSPTFRALDARDLCRGLRAHGAICTSPAFCALDTRDLRRGLRAHRTNCTLACMSRTRHARPPQGVARTGQIALSLDDLGFASGLCCLSIVC